MEIKEFETLQKKVEILKEKQAKASGTIESAEKQLVALGITDVDSVDEALEQMEKEISSLEEQNDADYAELKGLYSWQFV